MVRKLFALLLLFDFSKAFDSVSPSQLLIKLKGMGFSRMSLLWIKSYLQDRQLQVASKKSSFDLVTTNLGVPQGSVLGPMLFCLYKNDLKLHLTEGVFYLLNADDLQVYVQIFLEKVSFGIEMLSMVSKNISNWAENIMLRLNQKKTKAIFYGMSPFVNRLNLLDLEIEVGDNIMIPIEKEVKSIGVILDNKLLWYTQITAITKKVN